MKQYCLGVWSIALALVMSGCERAAAPQQEPDLFNPTETERLTAQRLIDFCDEALAAGSLAPVAAHHGLEVGRLQTSLVDPEVTGAGQSVVLNDINDVEIWVADLIDEGLVCFIATNTRQRIVTAVWSELMDQRRESASFTASEKRRFFNRRTSLAMVDFPSGGPEAPGNPDSTET
jgi:hypothetical protein